MRLLHPKGSIRSRRNALFTSCSQHGFDFMYCTYGRFRVARTMLHVPCWQSAKTYLFLSPTLQIVWPGQQLFIFCTCWIPGTCSILDTLQCRYHVLPDTEVFEPVEGSTWDSRHADRQSDDLHKQVNKLLLLYAHLIDRHINQEVKSIDRQANT